MPPFDRFLEEHRRDVYRFLMASVGPVDADDVFQETFLAALRGYPNLRDGRNLRGWVLAIATRKVIDAARARARRPVPVPDVSEMTDGRARAGAPPSQVAIHEDGLWRAVATLPPQQRAAVAHRFVLDLPYEAVGRALGCSEEAARAHVYQGLKKLREVVTSGDEHEGG